MRPYLFGVALLLILGLTSSANAQYIGAYVVDMSGTESSGRMQLVLSWASGDPCQEVDEPLVIRDMAFDGLAGAPLELKLRGGYGGTDGVVLLGPMDWTPRRTEVPDRDWPVCSEWLFGNLYFQLTTTAFPEGEIRGPVQFALLPVQELSWGRAKAIWRE